MVTLTEPYLKLSVQFIERTWRIQSNFIQKGFHCQIEPFLFSFALGISRSCIQQTDSQQSAGTNHPVGTVLTSVVKVKPSGNTVFLDGTVQRIFYNALLHIVVEFTMQYVPGTVIDEAGKRKIGLYRFPVNFQNGTVLDVSLPQVMPVFSLEALGCVAVF